MDEAGLGLWPLLAIGTLALHWLDYQRLARGNAIELYTFVIATGFLTLGLWIGLRLVARAKPRPLDGNPQAQAALGISAHERDVLEQLASGRSKKEIAPPRRHGY